MGFYRTWQMHVNFTEFGKQIDKPARISKYRIFIVLKYFRILRYCVFNVNFEQVMTWWVNVRLCWLRFQHNKTTPRLDVSQCNLNISWLVKSIIYLSFRQFINQTLYCQQRQNETEIAMLEHSHFLINKFPKSNSKNKSVTFVIFRVANVSWNFADQKV